MSLLVLKESAIIDMICLFFKVRDVPKSLYSREAEAYWEGLFPRLICMSGKAWMKAWESLLSLPGFDAQTPCL